MLTRQQDRLLLKSYPSCVIKATNIAMEANKLDINFKLPKGQVTKTVASHVQNELVIGLEDNLLKTHCSIHKFKLVSAPASK